jgi:hypothetical protein
LRPKNRTGLPVLRLFRPFAACQPTQPWLPVNFVN